MLAVEVAVTITLYQPLGYFSIDELSGEPNSASTEPSPLKSKSTLKSIYARDRVRFIRVSGTFIASPQITSDNKAEELKKLLIQHNQLSTVSETPQFNTPDLHFTRYLENLGYDVYLGQDNDDDETEIECILLKPKKFICEDIATVNVSKNGEPQIHWIKQTTKEFTLKTAINYLITQDNNKNDSDSDKI